MRAAKSIVGILCLCLAGCGLNLHDDADGDGGKVTMPLVVTEGGVQYRLAGATFTFTGAETKTISDTSSDTLVVSLTPGLYTLTIGGNFRIEKTSAPGVAVPASLKTPNPVAFTIKKGATAALKISFALEASSGGSGGGTDGGSADAGNSGTLDPDITVDSRGWVSGTVTLDTFTGTSFTALKGVAIPFTFTYGKSTVTNNPIVVTAGPMSVQFGVANALLVEELQPAFEGSNLTINLTSQGSNKFLFAAQPLTGTFNGATYSLEVIAPANANAGLVVDGLINLDTLSLNTFDLNATITLKKTVNGTTSSASGPGTLHVVPR